MGVCGHLQKVGVYHDGELDAADHAQFERHLSGCQACAKELRETQALSRLLAAAAPPDVPRDVLERLRGHAAVVREGVVVSLAQRLIALAAGILIVCAAWALSARGDAELPTADMASWERAATTLRAESPAADVQQVAQWIVSDLSLENGHD